MCCHAMRYLIERPILTMLQLISFCTVGLCVRKYKPTTLSRPRLTWLLDMFASGAGGVHGWEIDAATFNIFLMVDTHLKCSEAHCIGPFAPHR